MTGFRASIVMPAYNAERYIRASLESAASQTLPPHEIIVVDDGSNDETSKLVVQWSNDSSVPLRLVRKDNGGAASARNLGIKEASGEWICFLDSDDLYEPNALEIFSAAAAQYPATDWIGGDLMSVSEDLSRTVISSFRDRGRIMKYLSPAFESGQSICLERPWRAFLDVCMTSMGAVAVRRALLLKCGGFREDLQVAEDYQLWIRLARSTDFCFVPKRTVRYREREGSLMNSGKPPRYWTKKAFRQLVDEYGFDGDEATFVRRMSTFDTEDAQFYAEQGATLSALRCWWNSTRHGRCSWATWTGLMRTLLIAQRHRFGR